MKTPTETPPTDAPNTAPDADASAPEAKATAAGTTPSEGSSPPTKKPAKKDPLHGVTLEAILESLVARHGWEAMGRAVEIKCFLEDPSIKSSLTFLRRTLWAREKVEHMYITNDLRPAWRKRGKGRGPRS